MFHDRRLQTFGDLANFNPHVHAVDGPFLTGGTFVALPPVHEALLIEGFRRAVLAFLVSDPFGDRPCGRHSGR